MANDFQPEDRLESWKEIASYLKRDVRTVQRWEKQSGLPIHRLRLDKSGTVYAYKSELDVWWNQRRVDLEPNDTAKKSAHDYAVWTAALSAVIVLALGAGILARGRSAKLKKLPQLTSVAVLPLTNLTGDESQEYLSDGMTDALITELAQIPGLRVISRTSTIQYKGTKKSLPQIARELNVDAIVEGTVTRGNDKIKITAQLIHGPSDIHLWAGSVSGAQDDVLQLQNKVATSITSKIEERLTSSEPVNAPKPLNADPKVYETYLKGIYYYNRHTPQDVRTAIHYFQLVVDRDSTFAAAYTRIAYCYFFLTNSNDASPAEAYAPAKEAIEKALATGEDLDDAHSGLATIAWLYDWDWTKAEIEFKRAIQLNPNSAYAHLGYSYLLQIQGRAEESTEQEAAARLLDPFSFETMIVSGTNAYYRRQFDDAIAKAHTALNLYPQIPMLHVLPDIFAAKGQNKLAADEILTAEEFSGASADRLKAFKAANDGGGLTGLRRKRIEFNKKPAGQQPIDAYDIAVDCAAIGEKNEAIQWLERALRARDHKATLIAAEPIFDGLRSNPRFVVLLNEVGLKVINN